MKRVLLRLAAAMSSVLLMASLMAPALAAPARSPTEPTPNQREEVPVDIPDEGVPLADIPDKGVPLADIPDEDVPLADIPDEDVPLADIPDEDVPLGEMPSPQTGVAGIGTAEIMSLLAAVFAAGGAAALIKAKKYSPAR